MLFDLPASLHKKCRQVLDTDIHSVRFVGGGDINQARLLQTARGDFFIKYNQASFAGNMFEVEARGLSLLAAADAIRIPKVIATGETEEGAYLLLEFIDTGYRPASFWKVFGRSLARLHRSTAPQFGLDHSNYIGSLPQPNGYHDHFADFYIKERLQPQLEMALSAGKLNASDEKQFQKLYKQLPDLLPSEPPALIHGDLWSGNFMVGADGQTVLIDPSVAYSHRELDLGMSRLFGGFDRSFYEAYEEEWPLAPGFEKRLPLYQLYYLMAHVNLFGGGYVRSVRGIVSSF